MNSNKEPNEFVVRLFGLIILCWLISMFRFYLSMDLHNTILSAIVGLIYLGSASYLSSDPVGEYIYGFGNSQGKIWVKAGFVTLLFFGPGWFRITDYLIRERDWIPDIVVPIMSIIAFVIVLFISVQISFVRKPKNT
jgi:hypothetical protein